MKALAVFGYNLVLALWVGGIVLFTFVVTPLIFRGFDRDMAGEIVGKVIPSYFRYNLVLSLAALGILVALWGGWSPWVRRSCLLLLLAAVAVNAYINFGLYPKIGAIKREVATFREDPDAAPRKAFRRLHAVSASLNLVLLADGVLLLLLGPAIRK